MTQMLYMTIQMKCRRTIQKYLKFSKKPKNKGFDASNYDTIHKAEKYITLLVKVKKAFEEYVDVLGEMTNAFENVYEVEKRVYGAGDDIVKKLEEEAKESRQNYETVLKVKNDFSKENETKKATAQAFIYTLKKALNEVLSGKN